jgi:predicted dehydrogenase
MERQGTDRIRLGTVGGGRDAFIGVVHRIAARLDDRYALVAGCFSSTAEKSRASGADLGLDPDRVYVSFVEMAECEAARSDGIEAVSIVTPNHLHAAAAREFLTRGIHVICEKPMTATLEEARELADVAAQSDALFVLTHTYTGYPMIRQAGEMVAAGELGALRLVQVEYAQDWLTEPVEESGAKQAVWRVDPAQSGAGGCIGDIGTHAFNLACTVTREIPSALSADLHTFVPGRRLDDNAHVMMRYESGMRGMLWVSQVAAGCENALRLRVFGTEGGLDWSQEEPNVLWHRPYGGAGRRLTRAGAGTGTAAGRLCRVPAGHPEGYLEAFANLYSEAASAIEAHKKGQPVPAEVYYAGTAEGMAGLAFVDACVRSSRRDGDWVELDI